jgi:hypothetical protein
LRLGALEIGEVDQWGTMSPYFLRSGIDGIMDNGSKKGENALKA